MIFTHFFRAFLAAAMFISVASLTVPSIHGDTLNLRQDSGEKLVFCHFMIGIVGARSSPSEYDADMQNAKAAGIDAFALNIGVDPYSDAQLDLAYQSAANNGMKVFISFDFNWYGTGEATRVGQMIAKYGSRPAQLMVDGKAFASSFAGDGLDVGAMRSAAGIPVFWAPNFHPESGTDFSVLDGALNWLGWPNNGNNKAPDARGNVSVQQGDATYIAALRGKPYIAPVSPWFSTHFGPEVPYSKNWVFPSDTLWYDRWQQILSLQPRFLEIVTWNDYGESHYVGRLDSPHGDDGNSKWVYGFPHNGWLDMAQPFIKAFRAGASDPKPYITEDKVVYWFRPTLRGINCDATDTTMSDASNSSGNYFKGRPDGWQTMEDKVYIVTLLKEAASLMVNVAGNSITFQAPAGAAKFSVDMKPGTVAFNLARGGSSIHSETAGMQILDQCPCGIYNFNPYVGTIPAGRPDELLPAAYSSIHAGLKVSTCGPSGMKRTAAPLADVVAPAKATPSA
ncbi:mutanase [Colletotrichum orchidophilum]|uniref:Mutanase n=1 Tax=Colletotrichum orchidophilum TaxID=1209926 RepID=A0A1G4BKW1_9PEZI|nr:mutanase [Colletotrichum orchidophilum]OHF01937.1 mutanase [Colletotrichum orchidophilum]